jgi:KipI family sensor histidine kinase inhibitor
LFNQAPTFEALADDAWLIHVGEAADPTSNPRVHALAARIRAAAPEWLRDLTPAYASLAVYFDDMRFDGTCIDPDTVRHWLEAQCHDETESTIVQTSRLIEIPVRYGGRFGDDIIGAASELGLAPSELIARHSAPLYTVAMIGFAPGFPYLSGLDPALALPRLATPRTRVPAGSVGIGGAQTGIYPRESPGGWRLIGRTPLTLFDPQRATPSLLAPGDRVRFVAIDDDAFARLAAQA